MLLRHPGSRAHRRQTMKRASPPSHTRSSAARRRTRDPGAHLERKALLKCPIPTQGPGEVHRRSSVNPGRNQTACAGPARLNPRARFGGTNARSAATASSPTASLLEVSGRNSIFRQTLDSLCPQFSQINAPAVQRQNPSMSRHQKKKAVARFQTLP